MIQAGEIAIAILVFVAAWFGRTPTGQRQLASIIEWAQADHGERSQYR